MKQRIFGNPFGQFLLILAEIVGLAGSAYLGIQCLILTNSFGGLFEGENLLKGIMSFGTLFLPVLMLFIAFVGTIVGLVEKNRGVGVMSVIFVLLAMLVQGVCFVVGYADLANFFQNINWGGFFDLGLDLVILGYVVSVVAFIFALFAICFAAGRKKGASIVFAIIALILYIAAAIALIALSGIVVGYALGRKNDKEVEPEK